MARKFTVQVGVVRKTSEVWTLYVPDNMTKEEVVSNMNKDPNWMHRYYNFLDDSIEMSTDMNVEEVTEE
jgi:hypothetical protein